ncbi:MAG: hypothetical protein KDA28_07230, partial [Phycisphaerales bacterium]|nr:hypothetical protein [Phycisphaerales bacterium]
MKASRPISPGLIALVVVLASSRVVSALGAMPLEVDRGLESSVELRFGPTLREREGPDRTSPVRVRVSPTGEPGVQRVSFIGIVAGAFDLRDFLAREDGAALTDLPPMPIEVVSRLPEAHGLDLFEGEGRWGGDAGWSWRRHYRLFMLTGVVLWLAFPLVVFARWFVNRPRPDREQEAVAPPPTTTERLVAAIRDASGRSLSVRERAALELLLIRALSEHHGLVMVPSIDHASTLEILRRDTRTGPVVRAVERWLHASGDEADRAARASRALVLLEAVARDAVRG